MALRKRRMFLGRAKGTNRSTKLTEDNAYCLLELIEGWWHIDDLRCPNGLKVNGVAVKRIKLMPDDEFVVGKYQFRITFKPLAYGSKKKKLVERKERQARTSEFAIPAIPDPGPNGRLVPVGGGSDHRLQHSPITVGRRSSCCVVLPDKKISGKHCKLTFIDGHWQVEDLGSRNGVRIEGRKCDEGWVLPGQRLTIGTLRFRLDYASFGPPPVVPDVYTDTNKSLLSNLGLSAQDFGDNDSDEFSNAERLRAHMTTRRDPKRAIAYLNHAEEATCQTS